MEGPPPEWANADDYPTLEEVFESPDFGHPIPAAAATAGLAAALASTPGTHLLRNRAIALTSVLAATLSVVLGLLFTGPASTPVLSAQHAPPARAGHGGGPVPFTSPTPPAGRGGAPPAPTTAPGRRRGPPMGPALCRSRRPLRRPAGPAPPRHPRRRRALPVSAAHSWRPRPRPRGGARGRPSAPAPAPAPAARHRPRRRPPPR